MKSLSLRVGRRIRALREEADLKPENVAHFGDLSKGHVSKVERGLVQPNITTLAVIARVLEVDLLDLVTFPDEDLRQELVERTRTLPLATIRRLLKELPPTP